MTNAEAQFNNSLRPRKPEGLLGQTAQDGHLDSHTAPELWVKPFCTIHPLIIMQSTTERQKKQPTWYYYYSISGKTLLCYTEYCYDC